jgi:hypothetical protein
MSDIANVEVPVTLSYYEIRAVRAAAIRAAKRAKAEDEKKPFTPEPGKINTNQEKAKTLYSAADKLNNALTKALTESKKTSVAQPIFMEKEIFSMIQGAAVRSGKTTNDMVLELIARGLEQWLVS